MTELAFSTDFPLIIYFRPQNIPAADWQEYGHGTGFFTLPPDSEFGIRARLLDDDDLRQVVNEIKDLPNLVYLNLAENRKITDVGVERLKHLRQITNLNLSSVDLTNKGLPHLLAFTRLETLDLSYCNRITDPGLKIVHDLRNLVSLNLQGCVKVTNGGLARIRRRGLIIHR